MNLKQLLKSINYKSTFNVIYKSYYKDRKYSDDKIIQIDEKYRKAIEELSNLEFKSNKDNEDLKIYVLNVEESEDNNGIDVCLFDENEDQIFSIDFYPWDQLVELEIQNGIGANNEELAAHILWELTFWGFTSEEVNKQAEATLKSIDEPVQSPNS